MSRTIDLLILAYSYLRFSSPVQAHGDSVRRQDSLRDAWLLRNNVTLDTSVSLRDEGVSAFAGNHRQNPDRHALAAFLELVKQGRIKRGSYLIVESLDRLSREHIRPALTLLLNLIEAGIRVVQLLPVEAVYDERVEPMQLMMAIMELSRGHSESKMKSERVGGAWREKKRVAAMNCKPLTARAPAWLKLVNGSWKFAYPAADIIKRIVRWAIEGHGMGAIVKRLNAEGIEPLGVGKQKAEYWAHSSIAKILRNPALIGQYQPYTGRWPERKPDGEPIAGYYPPLITQDEWFAMQSSVTSRRGKAGRPPRHRLNLFANLMRDAPTGGTLHIVNKGKESSGPSYVQYRAVQGVKEAKYCSFPVGVFETAILSELHEIDVNEILPGNDSPKKVMALTGKYEELDDKIKKLKAQMTDDDGDSSSLADVLRNLDKKLLAAKTELEKAQQEAASPLSSAWEDCKTLLDVVEAMPDKEEGRVRLRAAIRRIVEGVWCVFVGYRPWRVAAAQVCFAGGQHRSYIILHKEKQANTKATREPQTWPLSFADIAADSDLDLRKLKDARQLARVLEAVDFPALGVASAS